MRRPVDKLWKQLAQVRTKRAQTVRKSALMHMASKYSPQPYVGLYQPTSQVMHSKKIDFNRLLSAVMNIIHSAYKNNKLIYKGEN